MHNKRRMYTVPAGATPRHELKDDPAMLMRQSFVATMKVVGDVVTGWQHC